MGSPALGGGGGPPRPPRPCACRPDCAIHDPTTNSMSRVNVPFEIRILMLLTPLPRTCCMALVFCRDIIFLRPDFCEQLRQTHSCSPDPVSRRTASDRLRPETPLRSD